MDFGKAVPYDINIKPSNNNGFIVHCGCGVFVFNDLDEMIACIRDFIENPTDMENLYNKSVGAPVNVSTDMHREIASDPVYNEGHNLNVPSPTGFCS